MVGVDKDIIVLTLAVCLNIKPNVIKKRNYLLSKLF